VLKLRTCIRDYELLYHRWCVPCGNDCVTISFEFPSPRSWRMALTAARLKTENYFDEGYWDNRYSRDSGSFDWYQQYKGLAPLIKMYTRTTDEVLMVGCGSARMQFLHLFYFCDYIRFFYDLWFEEIHHFYVLLRTCSVIILPSAHFALPEQSCRKIWWKMVTKKSWTSTSPVFWYKSWLRNTGTWSNFSVIPELYCFCYWIAWSGYFEHKLDLVLVAFRVFVYDVASLSSLVESSSFVGWVHARYLTAVGNFCKWEEIRYENQFLSRHLFRDIVWFWGEIHCLLHNVNVGCDRQIKKWMFGIWRTSKTNHLPACWIKVIFLFLWSLRLLERYSSPYWSVFAQRTFTFCLIIHSFWSLPSVICPLVWPLILIFAAGMFDNVIVRISLVLEETIYVKLFWDCLILFCLGCLKRKVSMSSFSITLCIFAMWILALLAKPQPVLVVNSLMESNPLGHVLTCSPVNV
jgi:hypothetical protein